jgi:hypothetical protein
MLLSVVIQPMFEFSLAITILYGLWQFLLGFLPHMITYLMVALFCQIDEEDQKRELATLYSEAQEPAKWQTAALRVEYPEKHITSHFIRPKI